MNCARGLVRLADAYEGDLTSTTELIWVAAMHSDPNSISVNADGTRLLQWHSGRYERQHIAVLFDPRSHFVRITHRYRC